MIHLRQSKRSDIDAYIPLIMRDRNGQDVLMTLFLALNSSKELKYAFHRNACAVHVQSVDDIKALVATCDLAG